MDQCTSKSLRKLALFAPDASSTPASTLFSDQFAEFSLFFSGKQGNGTGGGFVPDCLDHQAVRHEWLPFPSCEERCVPRQLALWEAGLLRLLRRFCRGICMSSAPPVCRRFARFPDGGSYRLMWIGSNRARDGFD